MFQGIHESQRNKILEKLKASLAFRKMKKKMMFIETQTVAEVEKMKFLYLELWKEKQQFWKLSFVNSPKSNS